MVSIAALVRSVPFAAVARLRRNVMVVATSAYAFKTADPIRWAWRFTASPQAGDARRKQAIRTQQRMLRWPGKIARRGVSLNWRSPKACAAKQLNIQLNFVEGESLIMGIKGLAVSSGSVCTHLPV
jgi:hypothetical protein